MATREIISLVCDLHGGKEVAGAVPAWLGIGGQLYQLDVCPECAARLCEVTGQFITHARKAGAVPDWLPRPDIPAGRTVTGPTPKRDLILSVIRARIADGTYPAGSYLPAQRDLADEHGMSVSPVISACWELEGDGLICGTARGRYIIQPAVTPVTPVDST
jgi:hypothetical protein